MKTRSVPTASPMVFGETIEQVLQRRDRFQDARRLVHGGLEIDAARSDEEPVRKPLRNPAGGRHGKGDHERRRQVGERSRCVRT